MLIELHVKHDYAKTGFRRAAPILLLFKEGVLPRPPKSRDRLKERDGAAPPDSQTERGLSQVELAKTIGTRLRDIRRSNHGLTQVQLAKLTRIPGRISQRSATRLKKIGRNSTLA